MNKTTTKDNANGILVDIRTLCSIINCGRVTAERIAKEAGARKKIGKTVRYYVPAIKEYLASPESNNVNL